MCVKETPYVINCTCKRNSRDRIRKVEVSKMLFSITKRLLLTFMSIFNKDPEKESKEENGQSAYYKN